MIELKNVSFRYASESQKMLEEEQAPTENVGGRLCDINLTIADGSFVLLTGPSGCGKTTILRLLNGLIPHYYAGEISGEILVNEKNVSERELYETACSTGTVFQNPRSQFFNVDTTSELAFTCENRGMDANEIRRRMDETVHSFGLQKLMDRSIFQLSDGQKQKIACASIDVGRPDIILLDEPSANLDYGTTMQLRELIGIWKAQGKTIVAAEHRIFYLWDLIDRAVILRDGSIIKDLTRKELSELSDEDMTHLGLRTVHSEAPSDISLPAFTQEDVPITLQKFKFAYRRGMFERRRKKGYIVNIRQLNIAQSRITAITGYNGVGKTTLLHCLCGLEKKCKGKIRYKGKNYNRRKRHNLLFMVMQDVNHQLFTESALEEVVISLPKGSEEERQKKAMQILSKLDLAEFAQRHPMSLSGGQKQRLAVACAIASGREILLFDEPTSGLDYLHMQQTADLLRKLKEMGKTVIVVTHDSELIRSCCDRKLVIE